MELIKHILDTEITSFQEDLKLTEVKPNDEESLQSLIMSQTPLNPLSPSTLSITLTGLRLTPSQI